MRPAAPLLSLVAGWFLVGVLAALDVLPLLAWAATGASLAMIALVDAWRATRAPSPRLVRQLDAVLPLGERAEVTLRLRCEGARRQRVRVHDMHPGGWRVEGLPRALVLSPAHELAFTYTLWPAARGRFAFAGCQVEVASHWRLWHVRRTLDVPGDVRVFPNYAPLARMAGLSVELASRSVGARLQRRRGEGTEFQELRDYRVGDSLRKVDWKATVRSGRLMSRQYREESHQQVVLMLDCGRRMLAEDDGVAHFDQVLNASLALAYIALRQGDSVGLLACTGQMTRWLAPQQGAGGMDMVLGAGYDLYAQPTATDYLHAASELQTRQGRRALVVLVTNVRDEDDEELRAAVKMLSRRHLVLVVSLRELALDRAAAGGTESLESAIRTAGALRYLDQRDAVHARLRREGIATLDVLASELSGRLVERYLAIKRAGRL
ncbi:MAG TPA: DUF58 domain-containing protein [Luteibacter sp.]|uniref:DUF58 domain-containing protein n=1 Tax=Luteibacter sp. TaxID=1886636 RepID=UPI002F3E6E00